VLCFIMELLIFNKFITDGAWQSGSLYTQWARKFVCRPREGKA
jgi:hypothetical protein